MKGRSTGQSSSAPAPLETRTLGDHTINFFDMEAVDRDNMLQTRVLYHTRCMQLALMKELHIYDQCRSLCQKIGIWHFFAELSTAPENYAMTREFLATVKFSKETISFQLCNKTYRLTIDQLNELLRFRPGGKRTVSISPDFWSVITNGTGDQSRDKRASYIQHPVLRYTFRLIANSFFARGETAAMCQVKELFFMECLLSNEDVYPDCGYFLADHLLKVATNRHAGGQVSCCAIITLIAQTRGVDLNLHIHITSGAI